ncbi:protein transport protein HofC [Entomohabitans teleogrylli]|uniref:protein transport protein HofC n=1 Tax=Entomohabitans teleogrylli TaxID=1384589 RepID=UPI00073D717D|nr:protein transport protein HofC [Entomohabitans teleogrylli]
MSDISLWRWSAIDNLGQYQKGTLLAKNKASAREKIANSSLHLLSLKQQRRPFQHPWHPLQIIQFIRQLAALLQAGIPLPEGLQLLARQHPVAPWQALLQDITHQITHGASFSGALNNSHGIFPPLFIALIHTGELTGQLEFCCQHLASQQEQQYQLYRKVKKALRYPLFIMAVALLVTTGMVGFVLPEFAAIYRTFNAPLPTLTRSVIALSEWCIAAGPYLALLPGLLAGGYSHLRRGQPHWREKEQRLLLRLPLLAPLIRGQRLNQIFTTLALTQSSGLPLLKGLEAVEQTLNHPWWQAAIRRVKERITAGAPLSDAITAETIFTPLCIQLIRVGETTGAMDTMLNRLAHWHGEKANELADNLAATLEPLMMVTIGAIIGVLVIAMYLPVFQLGNAIG